MLLEAYLAVVGLIAAGVVSREAGGLGYRQLLLALSPFCAVTFGQALWRAPTTMPEVCQQTDAPMIPNARKFPRVVWSIADEWDYRLSSWIQPEPDDARVGPASPRPFRRQGIPPGPETPRSRFPRITVGRGAGLVVWDGPGSCNYTSRVPNRTCPGAASQISSNAPDAWD